MIITEFYKGQGLGNQLWCYVTTRVIALNKGYDFGIQSPERFKAYDFMDIDFGLPVIGGSGPESGPPITLPNGIKHYYVERGIFHPSGADLRTLDKQLVSIPDDTKIDGYMQEAQYIGAHKSKIKEWLKVWPEKESYEFSDDSICIINFRGGMYVYDRDFFLPESYWKNAVANMLKINKDFRFIVITDDVATAKKFFPNYEVFHFSISRDYVTIKNANYLILSNSSFAFFPAWLNDGLKFCIAPKYWGRYNTSDGFWSLGYNIIDEWHYQNKDGSLEDGKTCRKEFDLYLRKNNDILRIERKYDSNHIYMPINATTKNDKASIHREILNRLKNIPILFRINLKNSSLFAAILKTVSTAFGKTWSFIKNCVRSFIEKQNDAKTKIHFLRISKAWVIRWTKIAINASGIPFLIKILKENKAKKNWLSVAEIAAYRKKIKVYDVFTFFNELDLLEIRLNILDQYVDYFVIIEANQTFSGRAKPLYFRENRDRYKKWAHKIIYYTVTDVPKDRDDLRSRLYHDNKNLSPTERQVIIDTLTTDNVGNGEIEWFKEFYIKESIKKALTKLNDDDICYISDLDEIWNPELTIDYSKDDVFKPTQKCYMYFLNNRSDENWDGWSGTIVTKYKIIKSECATHLRTHHKTIPRYVFLENGGWHFNFLGGYEGARKKIIESSHFWYKAEETLPNLEKTILKRYSYNHKGQIIKTWRDEGDLPEYLLRNKEKYKKFFR